MKTGCGTAKLKLFYCHPMGYSLYFSHDHRLPAQGLEKFFRDGNKAGIQAKHADRLRLILARLNVAAEAKDMNLPGLRLHRLEGEYAGFWALDVSGNWRVIFQFEGHDIILVDYLDYH